MAAPEWEEYKISETSSCGSLLPKSIFDSSVVALNKMAERTPGERRRVLPHCQSLCLRSRDTSERNAGGAGEQSPAQQASERYHYDEPARQRGRNLAVGFRRKGRADQMR